MTLNVCPAVRCFLLALALVGGGLSAREVAIPPSEQNARRTQARKLLASPVEQVRVAGVRKLADMDFPWRVELLVDVIEQEFRNMPRAEQGRGGIPVVADAAIDVLGTTRSPTALDALLDALVKQKRPEVHVALILSLAGLKFRDEGPPLLWEKIEAALDAALASDDIDAKVAGIDAYGALGRQNRFDAIAALRAHEEVRVRSAVVYGIAALWNKKEPRGVLEFAEMIATESNRQLRATIREGLKGMTGGWDCEYDADCWRGRWEAFLAGREELVSDPRNQSVVVSTFFLEELTGERMLFVIDASSSMAGGKWDLAIRELRAAIAGLQPDQSFDIMVFASDVVAWQRKLVPAVEKYKEQADIYLSRAKPVKGGMTNIYGALEAAFKRAGPGVATEKDGAGIDTILLLTDGSPTAGEIHVSSPLLDENDEPILDAQGKPRVIGGPECYNRICDAVRAVNRFKRVKINTFGFGAMDDGLVSGLLMRLARESKGHYTHVGR